MEKLTTRFWPMFGILTLLGVVYWFMFDFLRWDMFDSPSFVGGARMIFGLEGGYDFQSRLSKPLVLLLPGLLEYLVGLHPDYSFIAQSIIAWYISAFLVYNIVYRISGDSIMAFGGMLAYVMCQPVAIFSFMILVDSVGWMVGLLIIWYSLVWFKDITPAVWKLILIGALSALGLLVKESAVFGFIFLGFYLLFSNRRFSEKAGSGLIAGGAFVIVFLVTQWLTGYLWQDTIVTRVHYQQGNEGFVFYNMENFVQVFRTIDYYWLLFALGVVSMRVWVKQYGVYREAAAFLSAVAFGLLVMPVWPFVVDRIIFMVAPGLIVFVAFSKVWLGRWFLPLVVAGGILNVGVSWLIYFYDTGGLLLLGGLIYSVPVGLALYINRKQIKFRF